MLTQEEQKRIEDEERRRIAEEQYRAQVRARLQPNPSAPTKKSSHWLVGLCVAILVILAAAVTFILTNTRVPAVAGGTSAGRLAAPWTPSIRYVPVSQKIADGQVTVRAHGYALYKFEILPTMRDAHFSGSFTAAGGNGNDVAAVVAMEPEFANWINGHQAKVFYTSAGRKTTDSFDVRLAPGRYCFAVSNTFSMFASKYVTLDASLNYQRAETY